MLVWQERRRRWRYLLHRASDGAGRACPARRTTSSSTTWWRADTMAAASATSASATLVSYNKKSEKARVGAAILNWKAAATMYIPAHRTCLKGVCHEIFDLQFFS